MILKIPTFEVLKALKTVAVFGLKKNSYEKYNFWLYSYLKTRFQDLAQNNENLALLGKNI